MAKLLRSSRRISIAKVDKIRRNFVEVIGRTPPASVELRLFYGRGGEISVGEIAQRIKFLLEQGNRSVTPKYRDAAITLLKQELEKRHSELSTTVGEGC